MQDVDAYLLRKGIELLDYFDETRPARIDDEHQVRLNYEAFFFADQENKELFDSDPTRYCGLLTDPVAKRRFRPHASSPSAEHEGVRYYFISNRTAERFRASPDDWKLPGWTM